MSAAILDASINNIGYVDIAPGDYYGGTLGSQHNGLRSDVTVRGAGRGQTRFHSKASIYSQNATASGLFSTAYDGTVNKTTLKNIHVSGMTIYTYGYGVTFYNVNNCSLTDVDILPEPGLTPQVRAHVRFLYCQNVLLDNVRGYDAGGNTFNVNGCDYFTLRNCKVFNTTDDAIDIDYNFLFVGGSINHPATKS